MIFILFTFEFLVYNFVYLYSKFSTNTKKKIFIIKNIKFFSKNILKNLINKASLLT